MLFEINYYCLTIARYKTKAYFTLGKSTNLMGNVLPALPSPTLDLGQLFIRIFLAGGEVSSVDFGIDLHSGVLRDHICDC